MVLGEKHGTNYLPYTFRWPRSADEAMSITKDQYRMLMQGLEIVARYPIEELKETPSIT